MSFTRHSVVVNITCIGYDVTYDIPVPKLWNDTIEAHRRAVREAVLDTTAELAASHGIRAITMSQIAEETGIGRATLYKYFEDVEAILLAWHERQIAGHLKHLAEIRDRTGDPQERLEGVLHAYALIIHESRGHHSTELSGFLHRDKQVEEAQVRLRELLRELIAEAAEAGVIRRDAAPDELVSYCIHALAAAATMPSKAAVRRLLSVVLGGLQTAT